MDTEPDTLIVYLKLYAHLFVKDVREGHIIPTFHISKTMDLNSTSDPIPIPHRHAPRSSRSERATMSHARTLSPAAVEPIEPPMEEHQP